MRFRESGLDFILVVFLMIIVRTYYVEDRFLCSLSMIISSITNTLKSKIVDVIIALYLNTQLIDIV